MAETPQVINLDNTTEEQVQEPQPEVVETEKLTQEMPETNITIKEMPDTINTMKEMQAKLMPFVQKLLTATL